MIIGPACHHPPINITHTLILLGLIVTIGTAIWGISQYGWYLYQLGALFLLWGIFCTIAGKLTPDEAAHYFIDGVKDLATTAMLVGLARGIALIMEDGQILHTLVSTMSCPLSFVSSKIAAVAMFVMQTLLKLFIPSGSGQAYVTISLLTPVADLSGVNWQVVVLAFQFGDEFSKMIIPTNVVLMGILGVAGVPYHLWFRFCWPLLLKLMLAASIVIVLAVMFEYSSNVQPVLKALP